MQDVVNQQIPSRPIPSAREKPLAKAMLVFSVNLLAISIVAFFLSPLKYIFTITSLFSLICVAYSSLRLAALLHQPSSIDFPEVPEEDLPIVSVLLPLYHETNIVDQLIQNICAIDYPKDKLDVIFVCEADDPETVEVIKINSKNPGRIFITNGELPRTKPHALNQALSLARGDIITVYDAEDRPHPGQIKQAALALLADDNLGVVQAPLTYYNARQNWLTKQFTLEYAALFMVWLPFLSAAKLPFPLGGTSNHIRRTALDQIGGWDSWNVTEDADISFRLYALHWQLGYIDLPTHEEAVSKLIPWMKQRSRWMKGYMQTWLVHMSQPWRPFGMAAFRRLFTLNITLGFTLLAGFFYAPGFLFTLCAGVFGFMKLSALHIVIFFITTLLFSYSIGITIGAVGATRLGEDALILSSVWMPLYWLLLCPATLYALWELWRTPFFWHKTEHGVRALSV